MALFRNILVLTLLVLPVLLFTGATPTARAQGTALVGVSPNAIADLTKTSGSVTFEVNVTNAPAINFFLVSLQYNTRVLNASQNSIDFSNNVLGTSSIFVECVDGAPIGSGNVCTPLDRPGVVSLGLAILGAGATAPPTNGKLFNVTFGVKGVGVSQIHILQALLANAGKSVQTQALDGYFSNKQCGTSICVPPMATFTVTPSILTVGAPATFNATRSFSSNPGATITSYHWAWGQTGLISTDTINPVTHQIFSFVGNFTVVLTVNDTFGTLGLASTVVNIRPPQVVSPQAGEVCLADPGFRTTTGLCPASSQSFTGPSFGFASNGTQLRVAVNLNNSASMNGFDITLVTLHNTLRPFDADLTGGILPGSAIVILKCIGRVLVAGNACSPQDNLDTIHLSVAAPNFHSANSTTGLLFTAVYNIINNTAAPISIMFQTGCGATSVPGGVCVSVFNGGAAPVAETTGPAATYSTITFVPFFTVMPNQRAFTFPKGSAASQSTIVTLRETDGFSCGGIACVDLSSQAASPAGLPLGLTATLIPPSISDPGTPNATFSVSITASTPPGVYPVNIMGRSDTTNTPFNGTTYLGSVVPFTVTVSGSVSNNPDFSIAVNPQTLLIQAGGSASTNVMLTSLNQFSGSGTLTVTLVLVCCPGAPTPTTILPPTFSLTAGGTFSSTLIIIASNMTSPPRSDNWNVIVNATSGSLHHSAVVTVQIRGPPDIPPTAAFTFSPINPSPGQQVSFDGSTSHDPDGTVISWQWNFGDGFISFGEFTNHAFANPGSFTVMLTVSDNVGLTASTSMLVTVLAPQRDDVSIVEVNAQPNMALSGQTVNVEVLVRNDGTRNETVSVSAFFNSHLIKTLNNVFIQSGNCFFACQIFVDIPWDTTGVAAGNYTISATVVLANDPTPADNTLSDGIVRVLPPPVLTLSPSSGPVGTLVTVHGSGFFNPFQGQFFEPVEIQVTFDNQLVGFFFINGDSFNFSFDVPISQAGIVHHVHAMEFFPFLDVQADFLVTSTPGALAVSVNTGTIYFPGDTAVIYVLVNQGGGTTPLANVQVTIALFLPNGTRLTLPASTVSTSLFKATFTVPAKGSLGTYAVVASVSSAAGNGSALASFEVKPTWLSSNSKSIAGVTAIAGVIGAVGIAWQRGYFNRRKDGESLTANP